MTNLPQGTNLQEIQRAFLALEKSLLRRIEASGGSASAPVSTKRNAVAVRSSVGASSSSTSTPAVVEAIGTIIQLLRLQNITIDPVDDLPLTDEDDCAIVSTLEIPVLIKPMVALRISVARAVDGVLNYPIPSAYNESIHYFSIDGALSVPIRIETYLDIDGDLTTDPIIHVTKRLAVFYNNTAPADDLATVTVALASIDPVDPGIVIAPGELAYIQQKDDNSGLELVVYY